MIYRILSGLVLLLVTTYGQAITEARLLSQSSSGQTVVFNLGTHDGITEGDYAVIVKQIRDLGTKDLRYIPAAKARNIRISTDSSVWILYYIYDAELMIKGQKFIVLTESNMLRGRKTPTVGRTTVVAPNGKGSETAKSALADERDRLSRLKDNYQVTDETHGKEIRSDNDFDLVDLEEWEKARGDRYRSALYKSPHKEEFRRSYRLDTFQRMVASYLIRVNEPNFSYEKFYETQMRDSFSNDFRKKTNFNTEYEDFLYKQSLKATSDARLYRSILEKGESWSEDFSDEELRNVLKNVSVLQEADRRDFVISKPLRYSVAFNYGVLLSDAQTEEDLRYRREGLYEIGGDFEITPFLKHETLEHFTFNVSALNTQSAFASSGVNLDFNNLSMSVGANWYPLYKPYIIQAPLLFIGTYLRSGFANVSSPVTRDAAKYSTYAFPGFRAGLKYVFRNNVGLRIVASMETLQLERYETNRVASSMPESDAFVEGKLGLGLSYSF